MLYNGHKKAGDTMFLKFQEPEVMRDPIHDYIHVYYQVIWDCINAKEFQRLRRIRQLGGSFQIFHTAEHSRFSHCVGVYEIVRRMIEEVKGLKEALTEYEQVTVLLAGLLHDIGHGPFSHVFETISHCSHEIYTQRIILEDSEIHHILSAVNDSLPKDVASVIANTHQNTLMNQIISGQLDADRMDYLQRDAYFTGTSYGHFDMEKVLRAMQVKQNRIVVKESGIYAVENYIMARYHMYWQIYYHPVSRCFEAILTLLFKRLKTISLHHPEQLRHAEMFLPFLQAQPADITSFFMMDESTAQYGFHVLCHSDDDILQDLASRLLNRKLFTWESVFDDTQIQTRKQQLLEEGYDPTYYCYLDCAIQKPYRPYHTSDGHNIWVYQKDGNIVELSQASSIVGAISKAEIKEDRLLFYPCDKKKGTIG